MKKCEIKVKKDLFDGIGVSVQQVNIHFDDENDIYINGSLTLDGKLEERAKMSVKANLCDENGNILYILKCYEEINFFAINYETFSLFCRDLSRFFDMEKLHHVELYPHIALG